MTAEAREVRKDRILEAAGTCFARRGLQEVIASDVL